MITQNCDWFLVTSGMSFDFVIFMIWGSNYDVKVNRPNSWINRSSRMMYWLISNSLSAKVILFICYVKIKRVTKLSTSKQWLLLMKNNIGVFFLPVSFVGINWFSVEWWLIKSLRFWDRIRIWVEIKWVSSWEFWVCTFLLVYILCEFLPFNCWFKHKVNHIYNRIYFDFFL